MTSGTHSRNPRIPSIFVGIPPGGRPSSWCVNFSRAGPGKDTAMPTEEVCLKSPLGSSTTMTGLLPCMNFPAGTESSWITNVVNEPLPDLDSAIRDAIAASSRRLTLTDLERRIFQRFRIGRRQVRQAVRRLLENKELQYTYTFGTSFLEASVNHPVFIPPRIWIVPSGTTPRLASGQVSVLLQAGAAFGAGDHPSTRLALRALQWAVTTMTTECGAVSDNVLDVGTGSGILLIAALLLGVSTGTGIDTDPCARAEAQHNLLLNRLEARARIHGGAMDSLEGTVGLILANLRLPTIVELLPEMDRLLRPGAIIVFSGIHPCEASALEKTCVPRAWTNRWAAMEKDWLVVVFQKTAPLLDGKGARKRGVTGAESAPETDGFRRLPLRRGVVPENQFSAEVSGNDRRCQQDKVQKQKEPPTG